MPNVADSWKEYNTAKKGGILKSPYNFINPPNQVYETPWNTNKLKNRFGDSNGLPSHSKPFADAICGTLEIDWTFETPFLIGGADDGNSPVTYGEDYVLPGASIRGMLRNVLEIATAARVCHMDREARFSFRDFIDNNTVGQLWNRLVKPSHISGGYLIPPSKSNVLDKQKPILEGWTLVPCEVARIDQDLAAKALGGSFSTVKASPPRDRYGRFGIAIFSNHQCHVGERINTGRGPRSPFQEAIPIADFPLPTGDNKEIDPTSPVVTGHISPVGSGIKNTSWLFHFNRSANRIPVPPSVIERFIQSHSGMTGDRGALDFWRKEYGKTGASYPLPEMRVIFYKNAHPRKNDCPQDFFISLSRLMKVPHKFSIGEVAEKSAAAFHAIDEDSQLDFIQALFGHVPEDETMLPKDNPLAHAWKGRVFFRHGVLDEKHTKLSTKEEEGVTEKPRPSFAPYYLRHKPNEDADTSAATKNQNEMLHWSRENIRLAGRKRYPIREKPVKFPQLPKDSTAGNSNKMNFISSGGSGKEEVTFRSKIKIHNLHPIELGGLIWAIGFCNLGEENTPWRHAMGRGKPQGYGRVRGSIVKDLPKLKTNKGEEVNLNSFSEQFETWLCEQAKDAADNDIKDINDIDHIAELRAMANPAIGAKIAKHGMLEYPNVNRDSIEGYKKIKKTANDYISVNDEYVQKNVPALHLWRYPKGQRGDS